MTQVLLLGNASDAHAAHMHQALQSAGVEVNFWDTGDFPTQMQLSWEPHSQQGSIVLPGERELLFSEIHSVYWRQFRDPFLPALKDHQQQQIAISDSLCALRSLIQACPTRWVNSWRAYQFHREKPLQLAAVKRLGVPIPDTLISNDARKIQQFVQTRPCCIFKPVFGGAHTEFVTDAHLLLERMELALKLSPVTVQEYIAGTNIRSYVIGQSVYTAEIRSPSVDFRNDEKAELIPVILPNGVYKSCLEIARQLHLEWTAIDWRCSPQGDYVFLEANPSPMFIYFEKTTGYPITEKLVELLIS
ncbi:MAG: RimK family alpha-L-glutamate ligase [Leptolyngbyaceae cyanobacterium]